MFKISVIADSLSLPRKVKGDVVQWEETWPHILESQIKIMNNDVAVINFGKRERTSGSFIVDFDDCIYFVEPSIIILQVGVVDGMPRIFSFLEKSIISHPYFHWRLKNWIVKKRSARRSKIIGRNPLRKVWVKPREFENNFINLMEKINEKIEATVIAIPILADVDKLELKSPGYKNNVSIYNTIIHTMGAKYNNFLSVSEDSVYQNRVIAELFCKDGYHFNAFGNKVIAEKLLEMIVGLKKI